MRLPCVHAHWLTGLHFHDPHYEHDGKRIELVDAIRHTGKVVVTTDRIHADGYGFDRTGYVAVFKIDNLTASGSDIEFDLVERIANLE